MTDESKECSRMSTEGKQTSDSEIKIKRNGIITDRDDLTRMFQESDNLVNKIYLSEVPQICKEKPCQLGVDEAGRGPVLGPMLYGISYAPLSEKQLLVDLGCADSKTLTESKRDVIFEEICANHEKIGWAIESISPSVISTSMNRRCKVSLNEISMNSAIGLIKKAVEAGVYVSEVYVDTVGPPEKYQAKLKEIFPEFKIVVAKKADSTYPIVSAASICAKVSRDHALRAWQFCEEVTSNNYGSGYPNDPVTKKWLIENVDSIFGFPTIVRFSWSTAENILKSKAVTIEWENEKEEKLDSSEQKISKFFGEPSSTSSNSPKKRHVFFTERCLSSVSTL